MVSILRRRLLEFVEDISVGELELKGAGDDWSVEFLRGCGCRRGEEVVHQLFQVCSNLNFLKKEKGGRAFS